MGAGGNLKSIDEYKAQINNQIRPPYNATHVATARAGITPLITSNMYDGKHNFNEHNTTTHM